MQWLACEHQLKDPELQLQKLGLFEDMLALSILYQKFKRVQLHSLMVANIINAYYLWSTILQCSKTKLQF